MMLTPRTLLLALTLPLLAAGCNTSDPGLGSGGSGSASGGTTGGGTATGGDTTGTTTGGTPTGGTSTGGTPTGGTSTGGTATGGATTGTTTGTATGATTGGTTTGGEVPVSKIKAGVGVADMTPPVGYCAGQYCDAIYDPLVNGDPAGFLGGVLTPSGGIDPYFDARTKGSSYGVQSRLDTRAIVVEGNNGKRVALVKIDNYLAQDLLIRRVAQILAKGSSGITYDQIFNHVTHNHSAAYYSTLAVGVWLFEDVYDQRLFEYQARQIAHAIELAASPENLKPARMGATTIKHTLYKGNVVRQASADDNTPAGYPMEYNKHDLVVMRFDDMSDPLHPKPLAAWINWGEHPESLDGYNLHSADYLAPLQRFVDADIGVPMVFSQGDVGSSENSGNACQILDPQGRVIRDTSIDSNGVGHFGGNGSPNCGPNQPDEGVLRDWNHQGYVQTERNARYLADDVVRAFNAIGAGDASVRVPYSSDFKVDSYLRWTPGPLSHPYPSVSNCRTDPTLAGDPGVPATGLPDCSRASDNGLPALPIAPALAPLALVIETLKGEGLGIVPNNYDAPAFMAVEENLRIKLHTLRLGDVLLASCACEAQNDLILNLESRTDKEQHNIYDGFDWACLLPAFATEAKYAAACELQNSKYYDPALQKAPVTGSNLTPDAIAHMRAQVHNDAKGWDAKEYALFANTEAPLPADIKGNFTKEELDAAHGYALPVGVGHGGDYNGYTVSYREYQNRDSYRKALTTYGPHTADYMVTRLVRMAGAMKDGTTIPAEDDDVLATVDEARQVALSTAVGNLTGPAYDNFLKALPPDVGPAAATVQPKDVTHFQAATFSWTGGNNQIDNPVVKVQRKVSSAPDVWEDYAGQDGRVQTMVAFPQGLGGVISTYIGMATWTWTANFEAYAAFPRRLGSVPFGSYRFVVNGKLQKLGGAADYSLTSAEFKVAPWAGIVAKNVTRSGGDVSFEADPIVYPASYTSGFRFIDGTDAGARICKQCSFRPWARIGHVAGIRVTHAGGASEIIPAALTGSRYSATVASAAGDELRVIDDNGEISAPLP